VRIGEDNPAGFWYAKAQGSLSFAIPYQNKGHWLDFDVMMGGLSENMQRQTVSDAEARAQFNFYAIVASPILIGNLIENLDSYNLQTYANSEVIAINQDSLGVMGTLVSTSACGSTVCQVWSRLLANGNYAICLINYDPSAAHSIPVTWSMFGQSGTLAIRDLWAHASEGSSSTGYTFSAPPWGSTMLVISQYGKR
jgi:alpha-galactosidase